MTAAPIPSVRLRNFKSYEDVTLEFHPGVNVLVGLSDAGKSNVLRALFWAARNRPSGDGMRPWHWEGETRVDVNLDDGRVSRVKGSRNLYEVDGLADPLEGFGTGVPQAAAEALNLDPAAVHMLHDGPFLLRESPGEVARVIGRAAGLGEIEGTISWLVGEQRRSVDRQKDLAADLTASAAELSALSWIEDVERDVAAAEALEREAVGADERVLALERLLGKANRLSERLETFSGLPALERGLDGAEALSRDLSASEERVRSLEAPIRKAEALLRRLEATRSLDALEAGLRRAEKLSGALTASEDRTSALSRLVKRAEDLTRAVGEWGRRERQARDEYGRLAPETCPLCGAGMPR